LFLKEDVSWPEGVEAFNSHQLAPGGAEGGRLISHIKRKPKNGFFK
jgi:hypothetical protein